jgi:hypothetical protein
MKQTPVPDTDPPMSRADYVAANPKFAVFQSVLHIAMYVVRETSKMRTEVAVDGVRAAARAPEVK